MLIKSNEGDIIEVTGYKSSPLLVVMEETDIPVNEEDGVILLDFSTRGLQKYTRFLEGEEVDVTLELKDIIDYMGHDNKLGYPDEFWQLKKNGYNLVKVPIQNEAIVSYLCTDTHQGNLYDLIIRGGDMALYMGGYIDSYDEVDVFPLEQDNPVNVTSYYIDILNSMNIKHRVYDGVYHSPAEVVMEYDLPWLGIVYDGSSLWSTELALWCNRNKTIWVEPEKMSISYVGQLYRYMKKGYNIKVPYISMIEIDEEKANDILFRPTKAPKFGVPVWSRIEDDVSVIFLMLIFHGVYISKDTVTVHTPSHEPIDDFLEWMISSPIVK